MTIIQAQLQDLDVLVPLFDQYRQFYRKPSDEAAAREFLSQRMTHQQSIIYLALDESGKGMGFTQLYPSFSSVNMKRLWVLNDLFVHPDYRKQGVGEALMDAAKALGTQTEASGIMLETEVDNLPAQHLYDKKGYARSTDYYVYYLTY